MVASAWRVELALKSRLERCSTLPTLPAVAIKVLDLCQRDDLDLAEIAKVIANDPALAAKMLKTVNSPAFALRQEVRTLSHAVALLGVNSVRTLVLSFSLLRDVRRGQRAALNTYWKRSVLSGVAAREVAAALRFPFKEEAFLAALLQDIGMLALRQLGDPIYNDLVEAAGYDHDRIAAGERACFECDHAEVGAWLIGRWRLPDRFRTSTIYSHRPWRLEADAAVDLAHLVRLTALSGLLADIWIHPDATGAAQRAHIEAAKIFRLPGLSIEEVVRSMATNLPEVAGLFEVDLGSPETMGKVLDQAQEALAVLNVNGQPVPRMLDAPAITVQSASPPPLPAEPEGLRDDVTGLPGAAAAFSYVGEQMGQARRLNEPLSVIVAELDFGVGEGPDGLPIADDLLRSIAERLGSRLRKRDVLARMAGGRFMLILPETTAPGAVVVAERSRVHISELPHTMGELGHTPVTMSFGCATYQGTDILGPPALIAQAESALQTSRAAGGNRVTVHHADRPGNVARA
jgi:two-component system, cell cycle response regulator